MASSSLPAPRLIIQDSRYAKQNDWWLDDISLCTSGNIAVSGHRAHSKQSYVCIYGSTIDNSGFRDKPTLLYHKQFRDRVSWKRCISFIKPNSTEIVTCRYDEVQVIDYNRDVVLRSRKVNGVTMYLSVSESQIFIGLMMSDIVYIYDIGLNEIKSTRLKGFRYDYARDITAAADGLYICTYMYGRAIVYSQDSGSLLTEYTTGQDHSGALSIAVNKQLGLTTVLWYQGDTHQKQITFYLLSENKSFLTVDVGIGVSRIRISDQGRIVTGDRYTGEVMIYNVVSLFSYSLMKESLVSRLGRDDCEKLVDFFAMGGKELNRILNSDRPASTLILALEEKGVIQPSNVDRLEEAFFELEMSPSFYHAVNMYQKLRDKITSYGRFLATLSAHLKSSVTAELCDFFHFSDEQKYNIISSQNPGLSVLLVLDQMGIIKPSDVRCLEEPFQKSRLVQALAKIDEYKEIVKEGDIQLPQTTPHSLEVKWQIGNFVQSLDPKKGKWEISFKQPGTSSAEISEVSADQESAKNEEEMHESTTTSLPSTSPKSSIYSHTYGTLKQIGRSSMSKVDVPKKKAKVFLEELAVSNVTQEVLQSGTVSRSEGKVALEEIFIRSFEGRKFGKEAVGLQKYAPDLSDVPSHVTEFQSLLETKAVISNSGGVLEIPYTGVALMIPPYALPEHMKHCEFHVRIIPRETIKGDASFSSNSSTVLELLPNNIKFQRPVRLTLPHCLVLEETGERRAGILISHHLEGTLPEWEEQTHLSYHLEDTACIIMLDSLCWVKISVDDEIVKAKKLVVYTAARKLQPQDKVAEIQVGYYLDLPGQEQVVQDTRNSIFAHRKTFFFVKTKEKIPLSFTLDNIFPSGWQYDSMEPYSREITYKQIKLYGSHSLIYHIERTTSKASNLLCTFTVSQENRPIAVKLAIHLKVEDKGPSPVRAVNPSINITQQHQASLYTEVTVTNAGGKLEIPGTGVFLTIPPNALPTDMDQCGIHMRLTASRIVEDQVKSLCSDSSTAVEIFPCNLPLKCYARLSLPHCLKFKTKAKKRRAKIFTNLERGSPSPWEEQPDLKYDLGEDTCIIHLKQLCCVKYSIDDTIIKAKKIIVYTTAKAIKQDDELAEVEVGYHSDIPLGGELLRLNPNFDFDSKRTFLYMEKETCPLQVSLKRVRPKHWTCWVPKETPQEIPFNVIASSMEHSHLYVLQKMDDQLGSVICHFAASQKGDPIQIDLSVSLHPQSPEVKKQKIL